MTYPTKSHTLKVPGATLYYEVRGSGPVLVMIPGGPADAGAFAALAACLADRYTVVAYDPRGNSRSTFDGAPAEQDLDVHGDDAARLIQALDDEPAHVLGSSGGAQIGLDLAARHPARVRTLVAHEPPCVRLLDDAPEIVARIEALDQLYHREGVGPAIQQFGQLAGMSGPPEESAASPQRPPDAEAGAMFARINANLDYFLGQGLRPISFFVPDVETLRAGAPRVVIGIGEQANLAYRAALALAEKLGVAPVKFPGDHGGYGAQASAFAEVLHGVLARG